MKGLRSPRLVKAARPGEAAPRPAAARAVPRPWVLRLLAAVPLALALTAPAVAHQASDAYLRARVETDGRLALQVEVALRDLDVVLELDADADGRLTWGEVRGRQDAIADYVGSHLRLRAGDGRPCALASDGFALDRKADGSYAVLHYRPGCTAADAPTLAYALLQDVDPTHRGLLRLQGTPAAEAAPLRSLAPGGAPVRLDFGAGGAPASADGPAGGFFGDGLHHILIGSDHVLFLVCLLLPLALGRAAAVRCGHRCSRWPR